MKTLGLIFFFISANAFAGTANPSLVYKNSQAIKLFEEDRVAESKNLLQKEVVDHPKQGELHYNMGLTHEFGKEPDKAVQEYASAIRNTQDKDLQFKALFNIARLFGEKNDIKNALKYYQKALDIRPESEEVKTNIELLFKGGGQGKNNSQDQKNKENPEDKNKKDDKQQQQPQQNDQNKQNKPQPQQFKSKDLSEQDVKRILDELKRQEEQIRAKINTQKHKESPVEKDW
jgi:Ca-activated chloride channel family protein